MEPFETRDFYGLLVKGDLPSAMRYLSQFPEQAELLAKYKNLFEQEQYITYGASAEVNAVLLIYQQYYRDAFYLQIPAEQAEAGLHKRLSSHFQAGGFSLEQLEDGPVAGLFQKEGFHFLGGRTGGYWGPYIWRTTEDAVYQVELPEGVQAYTVRLLDGFLSRSWIDHLSFGAVGTGGWTNGDGLIHCVRSAYDLQSEDFTVSLLKHEAQHVMDLKAYPSMSSGDLEYRAKLVELIYSTARNLLPYFVSQADGSQSANGHAMAADRIAAAFPDWERCTIAEIQARAKTLFAESSMEIRA